MIILTLLNIAVALSEFFNNTHVIIRNSMFLILLSTVFLSSRTPEPIFSDSCKVNMGRLGSVDLVFRETHRGETARHTGGRQRESERE